MSGPPVLTPGPVLRLGGLQKRKDFLSVNSGRRAATPGFVLLGRHRGNDAPARVGFTCSKKVGNAVARNRAKRRLRALAAEVLAPVAQPGWDYVLIGRRDVTASRAYSDLAADLARAAAKVHGP
ncbi:MAG: ribonuclease P protein component [Pseudomonadota bacterium]